MTVNDVDYRAREALLKLLARKDLCSAQARTKLAERFSAQAAENAVAFAVECGYINDTDFAEKKAADLLQRKICGKRLAAYELSRLGLDKAIIRAVLDEYTREDIRGFLAAGLRKYDLSDEDTRRKAAAAFARKGQDWVDIQAAMQKICDWDEDEADDEGDSEEYI
jgi:SOS response regulatory protein OraA/RecX